jgi:hypothetical protein
MICSLVGSELIFATSTDLAWVGPARREYFKSTIGLAIGVELAEIRQCRRQYGGGVILNKPLTRIVCWSRTEGGISGSGSKGSLKLTSKPTQF